MADWNSGIKANAPTLTVWESLYKQKIGNAKDFGGGQPVRPDCKICGEPCVIGGIRLDCSHLFHYECYSNLTREMLSKGSRLAKCPICRTIKNTSNPRISKLRSPKNGQKTKSRTKLPRAAGATSSTPSPSGSGRKTASKRSGPGKLKWEIYKIRTEEKVNMEWQKEYGKKYGPGKSPVNKTMARRLMDKEFRDDRPVGARDAFIKPKSKYIAHHTNYERKKFVSKHSLKKSTVKPNRVGRDLLAEMRRDSTRRMSQVRRLARKEIQIPDHAKPNDPWRNAKIKGR